MNHTKRENAKVRRPSDQGSASGGPGDRRESAGIPQWGHFRGKPCESRAMACIGGELKDSLKEEGGEKKLEMSTVLNDQVEKNPVSQALWTGPAGLEEKG